MGKFAESHTYFLCIKYHSTKFPGLTSIIPMYFGMSDWNVDFKSKAFYEFN